MNKQEAEKFIKILLTADGGCEYCSANLIKLFCKQFPDFKLLAEESYHKKFGLNLKDLK
jgi:hypothetical protein